MKCSRFFSIVLCIALLTGCTPAAEPINIPKDIAVKTISRSEFPTFGGCKELHLPGNLAAAAATGMSYTAVSGLTRFSGSNEQAWEKLMAGELDVILAYGPPDTIEDEAVLMQEVGTDSLVFLVGGTQEPVSVTKEQILAAYQRGDTWQGYASAPNDYSHEIAADKFGVNGCTVTEGGDVLTAACPHTSGTLCYTMDLSMREEGQPENTAFAAIDGILPAEDTYPYRVPYFAACRAGLEQNEPAMIFYRWLTSEDGVQWLREAVISDLADEKLSSPDAS